MASFHQSDVENVMRTVFRRCVQCDKQAPSCVGLNCAAGLICVQTPPSCNACASVSCKPDPMAAPSGGNKANVGAIAGGVIGGIVFIAAVVFVVWKFCLRGKRQKYEEGEWQQVDLAQQEKSMTDTDFTSRRSARASTHTVASMASSVLTRASNIIQIAYIPGVTNRSGPGSPDLLVPPVPPIPAMSPSSGLSSPYAHSEQHFFVPDLRDSMASSNISDVRSSYARTSIAPSLARGSVASTMYRQNAIVSPLPAQTIVRGKAAVVSVKSGSAANGEDSPGMDTPPVPQIDARHAAQGIRIQMPRMGTGASPSNSIRSTATLGPVRALNITKKKGSDITPPKSSHSTTSNRTSSTTETLVPPGRPITEISVASTDDGIAHARARKAGDLEYDSESDDDDDHARARRSLLRDSQYTDIQDTPTSVQSPFSDSSTIERPDLPRRMTSTSSGARAPMTPIVEEGSKRASGASKRTQSPFSDDHKSDLK